MENEEEKEEKEGEGVKEDKYGQDGGWLPEEWAYFNNDVTKMV